MRRTMPSGPDAVGVGCLQFRRAGDVDRLRVEAYVHGFHRARLRRVSEHANKR
jgi:hypothetical protein